MKLFLVALVIIAGVFAISRNEASTKSETYYAGDALEYNHQVYVVTANTGYLELFRLNGNKLDQLLKIKPVKEAGMITDSYNSAVLMPEGNSLFIYAASGNVLYKYNIDNPSSPVLINRIVDGSWDWFGHMARYNGHLATMGSKGTRVWNESLQVIDGYSVVNTTNPYNTRLSSDGKFIFNVAGNSINIFDRLYRTTIRQISIKSSNSAGNRQVSYDAASNMLYLIDDGAVKQMNLIGDTYKTMNHDSGFGYDTVLSNDGAYLYVSNGTSVVKLRKSNFKFLAGFETKDLKIKNSWAMGLTRVVSEDGEKLVVFNNSNITILDNNLHILAISKAAANETIVDTNTGSLSLSLDKAHGLAYDNVALKGSGYWPNENVIINFAGNKYDAKADSKGKFLKVLSVPNMPGKNVDIKVDGLNSNASYSISFRIDK